VFTQVLLQLVRPAWQDNVQTPPTQRWPTGHWLPQRPQLLGSLPVSLQMPGLFGHLHTPLAQTEPAPKLIVQTLPQLPQLFGSARGSRHPLVAPLPQTIWFGGQLQLPRMQLEPAGQTVPQPPQWAVSLVRSTQRVPQTLKPGSQLGVPQTPPLQMPSPCAGVQTCPQPPQFRGS
jgi:hypothetical protein